MFFGNHHPFSHLDIASFTFLIALTVIYSNKTPDIFYFSCQMVFVCNNTRGGVKGDDERRGTRYKKNVENSSCFTPLDKRYSVFYFPVLSALKSSLFNILNKKKIFHLCTMIVENLCIHNKIYEKPHDAIHPLT